ncbi:MAG: hypothetical protein CR982_03420 [Candidatus Cloacimonadota bacterium]|nr:MAG: hypothetical protein CR982_03420 [Candidatus Cloacimonadota bacterium]PIE78833.1 MAG: hypothetical protein CSA15_05875 [Candidatus Delongbacteria bacterium]
MIDNDKIKDLFIIKFEDLKWENVKSSSIDKKSIIFADDEKSYADLISEVLEETGLYDVCSVQNGKKALNHYKKSGADIIITDIIMDTMTGVEFANKVLKNNNNQKIKFISGWVGEDVLKEKFSQFYEKGNISFLKKPFSVNQLLREVYLSLNPELKNIIVNTMDKEKLKSLTKGMKFCDVVVLYNGMRELLVDLSDRLLDKSIDQKSMDDILFPIRDFTSEKSFGSGKDESFKDEVIKYILKLSTDLKYVFNTAVNEDPI